MSHDQAPPLGIALPALLAALIVPLSTASAAPDDVAPHADLHDDMRVAPIDAEIAPAPDPQAGGDSQHVIYLNYEGGTISAGGNYESNSQENVSWVCQSNFTPFGAGQMQDASIQATRADWEAYGVTIVTSRPASGDYTMNMVGSASCGPNNSGVAPVDCNNDNPNDIVFTFANSNAYTADGVATINSQEIAHSFGLMHVNQPLDIMNPVGNGSNVSFLDECFSVTGNNNCGAQHAAQCGSQNQQNSHQELLALFGPSMPDTSAPTVSITSPSEGQQFTAPASFDVTADAADDQAISELRILIDGESQDMPDTEAPWSWPVNGVPVGMYTFEIVAVDVAGNESTSNAVTIEVVAAGSDDGGDGDGGGADDGDGGDAGDAGGDGNSGGGGDGDGDGDGGNGDGGNGDGGGDEGSGWESGDVDGALPPGFGLSEDAGSCACRNANGRVPAAAAILMLLGLVRRRRSGS